MLVPVILSGGSGTRLWPVSRASYPKQFVNLIDPDKSLLQATAERIAAIDIEKSGTIVVANTEHRFLIADQLTQVGADIHKILLEPVARNTAPAVALAAIEALKISEHAKLLIQTADHVIPDTDYFCERVKVAYESSAQIVTFGVKPTRPETGYGYIQQGQRNETGLSRVAEFVEKPDQPTAQIYVDSGEYLWNSGMFVLDAQAYLAELANFEPAMVEAAQASLDEAKVDLDFVRIDQPSFEMSPSDSIDYAVMERSDLVHVLPFVGEWSDLGAWDAVMDQLPSDEHQNSVVGDGLIIDSQNTLIRSSSRTVAALGVKDLLIVETPDVVLVTTKESAQNVKKIVEELRFKNRSEANEHTTGFRPWGTYQSICNGDRFQVKRIEVKPGKSLSLQMHHHRAEHWIVVQGTAEIVNGDQTLMLNENQSTFIPLGVKHRLTNLGKIDLVLIEVQSGSYLGEDDIVRFEDVYGR
ncbi:mannose-1-phosphate guanylyltransferase/mannose-6-phosphate isomerase [Litorivicinus lipolyticus]|uniref:mannose-1-phosphate guanylyltransferase/mannose-6-phosphate isomerase n=1 Tax=Litorivicinus lipolyticus TaxID=418701 RepID=UPI003B597E6F